MVLLIWLLFPGARGARACTGDGGLQVLFYQAMVRLPQDWSEQRKADKVNDVIRLLQLDDVADSVIGDEVVRGVSGGQRKRVNIGMVPHTPHPTPTPYTPHPHPHPRLR